MNKWEGVGRLTKEPEVKQTAKTTITNFTVAIDRRFKESDGTRKADFINCVCFGKTAELVKNFFHKGSWIGTVGSIQTRSYEKDGRTVYVTEAIIDEVYFVGNKTESQTAQNASQVAPNLPDDNHVNSDLMNAVMAKREAEKAKEDFDYDSLPFEF